MGEEEVQLDDTYYHNAAHEAFEDTAVLAEDKESDSSDCFGTSDSEGSGEDDDLLRTQHAPYPMVQAFVLDENKAFVPAGDGVVNADMVKVRWDPTHPTVADCSVNEYEIRIGSVVQYLDATQYKDKKSKTMVTRWDSWMLTVSEILMQMRTRTSKKWCIVGRDMWYVSHATELSRTNDDGTEYDTLRWKPLGDSVSMDDPSLHDWCLVLDVNYRKDIRKREIDLQCTRKVIPIYSSIEAAQRAVDLHAPARPYAVPTSFVMDSLNVRKHSRFAPFRNDRDPTKYIAYEHEADTAVMLYE